MSTNMKVPPLRFKEFSEEWEEKKLGDISVFLDSKRIPLSKSERLNKKGNYPYYGASGIIDYVDDYIFDGEHILLGEDGANIITRSTRLVFLATGKFWVNNHAHVFQAKESNSFLCEALERINYSKYNTGTAQPKLNAEVCKKIKLNMPTKQEQEKIAFFLSTVDTKIEQLTSKAKLLQKYKKGVVQKIFSQEIRFKDDDGSDYPEWIEKKLGEVTYNVSKKNKDNISFPVYSINNKVGFIPQGEQFEGMDSEKRNYDISLYKIIEEKTFAYNPARIDVGSLGYSGNLNNIIISSLYACFQTNNLVNDSFMSHYFKTFNFNKSVLRNTEGGVRNYLFYDNFSNIKTFLPTIEEQTKIANFLSSLDSKIEQVEKQLDSTKEFKKALFQQMFV